jgi:hypothetical protein
MNFPLRDKLCNQLYSNWNIWVKSKGGEAWNKMANSLRIRANNITLYPPNPNLLENGGDNV